MNIDTKQELTPEVWRAALADMPDASYDNLREVVAELGIAGTPQDPPHPAPACQHGQPPSQCPVCSVTGVYQPQTVPVPVDTLEAYRAAVAEYAARLDGWCAELAQQGFDVDRTGALSVTVKRPAP